MRYMAGSAAYKPQYYVDALAPAEADCAYPLIRSAAPEVGARGWRDYVQRRTAAGGLLGLQSDDGALSGLLSYRISERLRGGAVLAIDDFVTFELSSAAPGRLALLAAAERLARELGCVGLELRLGTTSLAGPTGVGADPWVALGFGPVSLLYVKRIAA